MATGNIYFDDNLLQSYYKLLYPIDLIYTWLCYGEADDFVKREFSFTFANGTYRRFLSFVSKESFRITLLQRKPMKIDIGAMYKFGTPIPMSGRQNTAAKHELIFDLDLSDYDDVRSCCERANLCNKCWKLIIIACKILDSGLREDFGFNKLLWIFSGRRGLHCWVADKDARSLSVDVRLSIVKYFTFKNMPERLIPALKRAVRIIDNYFDNCVINEQNYFGGNKGIEHLKILIGPDFFPKFEGIENLPTSEERWNYMTTTFQTLLQNDNVPNHHRNLIETIKLRLCLPRLDIPVTTSLNHLLKSPFSLHPETGKISVPIDPIFIDNFDPNNVPTLTQLIQEIDNVSRPQGGKQWNESNNPNVENTSLWKYINIFKTFTENIFT